jgi:phosphatidylglycerophosphate synthase
MPYAAPYAAPRGALTTGLAALMVLLGALDALVGLRPAGWSVGLGCGAAVVAAVAASRTRPDPLGPADLVTLARALLACAVAALVTDALLGTTSLTVLVAVAVVALLLDAVDGRVARRTGTGSAFGGRFDGEADAFLILVLSAYVASVLGWWVLLIGAARYAFGLGALLVPWMGAPLPFRYWRKVVTAVQGVALTVAAADVVPRAPAEAAVLAALALLAESFGRDVLWLWRHRGDGTAQAAPEGGVGTRLPVR